MDSRKLWQTVLGELELSVSRANFRTWFKDTAIISQENGHIVVAVPNPMAKNWLENKLGTDIKNSLDRMGVAIKSIEYRITAVRPSTQPPVKDPLIAAVTAPQTATPQPVRTAGPTRGLPVSGQTRAQLGGTAAHPQLNPRYSFDTFVVGPSNEMAYAAAQAVVRYPGEKYNPLFIYGGVGLGKTHLMQAIGNAMIEQDATKRVRYVTSEQLTNEFVNSLQTKKTKSFAELYRNLDVFIVDDIQFLGNKERTQEEFFHTFNALHQAGKQIIMSSDKPPKAVPHLEDRLRSRFEMGMTADVQRPDLETRAAIIQRKAIASGARLPFELVEYLARHVQHNIRELEGALIQLIAYCEHHHMEPSLSIIRGLLGARSIASGHPKTVTPKAILDKTAAYFELLPTDLTGTRRDRDIVVPRQIAMFIMRESLGLSYPKIGAYVGGRDHTTAMHSCTKIEKLLEVDGDLRAEINQVKERISL
jgi:chromosomal replication initiator protein